MKALISAFACLPNKGSEPGVGWGFSTALATYHDIHVLTRRYISSGEDVSEDILRNVPTEINGKVRFHFVDFPKAIRRLQSIPGARHVYYYLWQILAYFIARRLCGKVAFDVVHHVTYVKYWAPSFMTLLPVPFIWGPVGGGESAPRAFWADFSRAGQRYEAVRHLMRWLGERDPFVRLTARRSRLALATTEDTALRLRAIGCRNVRVLSQVGLSGAELGALWSAGDKTDDCCRLLSLGNLLHLKGFHLGLRAFAQANLPDAEYWIVGDGPERGRLRDLARTLGVQDRVRFWGKLPRSQALTRLNECDVLVHPSLHDSGGWVCLEAMAAGKPVVCLDLGGPAMQVTSEAGFRVSAERPEQCVQDMAQAIRQLADDVCLRARMGRAGRTRVAEVFTWERKGRAIADVYEAIVERRP